MIFAVLHGDPKTASLTLCRIALSFCNDFYQQCTKCLKKLGAANSKLIRVPLATGVFTLFCNVDVKITLVRTVHVTR